MIVHDSERCKSQHHSGTYTCSMMKGHTGNHTYYLGHNIIPGNLLHEWSDDDNCRCLAPHANGCYLCSLTKGHTGLHKAYSGHIISDRKLVSTWGECGGTPSRCDGQIHPEISKYSFYCSLASGHEGPHKAYVVHNTNSELAYTWYDDERLVIQPGDVAMYRVSARCDQYLPTLGMECSLLKGHDGDHIAHAYHRLDEKVLAKWSQSVCRDCQGNYVCSLPTGHKDKHQAYKYHCLSGLLIAEWSDVKQF